MGKTKYLPPELQGNYCRIAPESESREGQRLWFVSAPYGGTVLRFKGEPTSLLYAIAPLVNEIRNGEVSENSGLRSLTMSDLALLNPTVASENLYLELERRLKRQNLRAICISCTTSASQEARKIARLAKQVNPHTITILGGPHEDDRDRDGNPSEYDSFVDVSVAGDGEFALLQLADIIFAYPEVTADEVKDALIDHKLAFRTQRGDGSVFVHRDGRAEELKLGGRDYPLILDELPMMPRELVNEADTRTFSVFKNAGRNVKTAQIMTHRGCEWHCSFCSEQRRILTRSIESVVAEIEKVARFSEYHLDREDYQAVFFDDSTFTARSKQRRQFLKEKLFPELKRMGIEWGCQTRLDQIDENTLRDMKDAGCTYVFTGLESASNEMLRAMVKEQDAENIARGFRAINKVGLRAGVSLVFGVAELGTSRTTENRSTIRETVHYVQKQAQQGSIVMVSPNIATYYPGTLMTNSVHGQLDFSRPIVNPGYPWNRFEEGEGYHPAGIERGIAEFIIEESIKHFGAYMVDQDIYSFADITEPYRDGELDKMSEPVDFNHSSISRPNGCVAKYAGMFADSDELASRSRDVVLSDARCDAARLMGLSEEEQSQIVLTRNATEAASLVLWLTGLDSAPRGSKVITTNAENVSIPRAFRFYMDHGNPKGRDLWSSFQDFGAVTAKDYSIATSPTGLDVEEIDVLSTAGSVEDAILNAVTPSTRLVVFCHVIRDNGYICDVASLCRSIRQVSPDVYILVDGAQALGALPNVDVPNIGCDFYIAAPHKTLGSYPLGLLYINDRVRAQLRRTIPVNPDGFPRCVVMEGMFCSTLKVKPTVQAKLSLPEAASLTMAIVDLTDKRLIDYDSCQAIDEHRRVLKAEFINQLQALAPVHVISPLDCEHSNFILTFMFPDADNRKLVEHLWRESLVFVSYIARSNVIRASFGPSNSIKDVYQAIGGIREALSAQGLTRTHPNKLRTVGA